MSAAPLIGALFESITPKGVDKKRAVKPRKNKTTKGEGSVPEAAQQHGELASAGLPKPMTEHQQVKEHAKHERRRATEDWISGRISTKQHNAVHARAKHVISGKHPREFKGTTGERSPGKMGKGHLW